MTASGNMARRRTRRSDYVLGAGAGRTAAASILAAALAAVPAYARAASSLPAPFVYLAEIDPTIQQDMRYASANNFVGRAITGYLAPQCVLTRDTALALKNVQSALRQKHYSLKVYDCYRPAPAVNDFIQWSKKDGDAKMKQRFYPDLDKPDLFKRGFIATHSKHSHGNTVDLTIVPLETPVPAFDEQEKLTRCDAPLAERSPDNSLDFGTAFDCFDPKSNTRAPGLSTDAQSNRKLLVDTMAAEGFENYRKEWWHFELKGKETAEAYDFPIEEPRELNGAEKTPASKPDLPVAVLEDDCPGGTDKPALYKADCKGNVINIAVLDNPGGRSIGTIIDYSAAGVDQCTCRHVEKDENREWCKIKYLRTIEQNFEGWVLFEALQRPKNGSPPGCRRS